MHISHPVFRRTEGQRIRINHEEILCLPWLIRWQGAGLDKNRSGRQEIIARGLRQVRIRVLCIFRRNRGVRFARKVAFAK